MNRRILAFSLFLALSANAASAETLRARGDDGEFLLTRSADEPVLLHAGVKIAIPADARVHWHDLAVHGEQWRVAGVDPSDEPRLLVFGGDDETIVQKMPAPLVEQPRVLREPMFLQSADGVRGMAWLEGPAPRRQVLRVASLTETGWSAPTTLSPEGPGSQMALTAVSLQDGSFLLAWAAYDGGDDEILWTRWIPGASPKTLEAPRPVTENAVPDITPALLATDEEVLLAWSRYDGRSYRLAISTFENDAWSEPQEIGPPGASEPTWERISGEKYLIFQGVGGWTVLGLRGAVLSESVDWEERPILRSAAGGLIFSRSQGSAEALRWIN